MKLEQQNDQNNVISVESRLMRVFWSRNMSVRTDVLGGNSHIILITKDTIFARRELSIA